MAEERIEGGRAVLFDLDGTLADTAPDMAAALNRLLSARGRPALPLETIRPHVSHGGRALIRLGFGLEPDDAGFQPLRQKLLAYYRQDIARHTRLFPGVNDLLQGLEARGLPWGIVTNKPTWLTEPLLRRLGVGGRAACIVSGDTTAFSKPHPEPIHHACRLMDRDARNCWYVGDARRDIEAGRAAGSRTLVALFGYLGDGDHPETWGADGLIEHPSHVLRWLDG
jgi:2-phosphoglycolate phosphatase